MLGNVRVKFILIIILVLTKKKKKRERECRTYKHHRGKGDKTLNSPAECKKGRLQRKSIINRNHKKRV